MSSFLETAKSLNTIIVEWSTECETLAHSLFATWDILGNAVILFLGSYCQLPSNNLDEGVLFAKELLPEGYQNLHQPIQKELLGGIRVVTLR